MHRVATTLRHLDLLLTNATAHCALPLLRISLGIVFFWFGVLKFFPGLSPAQNLAAETIHRLTFGHMGPQWSLPILATWECLIGLGMITGLCRRFTLGLLFLQMAGTLTPLFLFPHLGFARVPYAPTMEGQYILKNLVFISAGLVIGATVRGGRLVAEPAAHLEDAPEATHCAGRSGAPLATIDLTGLQLT